MQFTDETLITLVVILAVLVFFMFAIYLAKNEIGKLLKDSLTSAAGDYDPARVVGYGVVLLLVVFFLVLATYDTYLNHKFQYGGYTAGLVAIAAAIASAAAGVWIKRGTEVDPAHVTTTQPLSVTDIAAAMKSAMAEYNQLKSATDEADSTATSPPAAN